MTPRRAASGLAAAAAAWALLSPCSAARPSRGESVESLEAKLGEVLDAGLGAGKAKVFIRVVDAAAPEEASSQEPGQGPEGGAYPGGVLWDRISRRLEEAPPVLPGYKVPSDLRAEALRILKEELRGPPSTGRAPAASRPAFSVSLLLDPDVNPEGTERARSTVASALGLDPDRGDSLKVSRALRRAPAPRPPVRSGRRETALRVLLCAGPLALVLGLAGALAVFLRRQRKKAAPAAQPPPPARPERPPCDGLILPGPAHEAAAALTLQTETPETVAEALRGMARCSAGGVYRRLPAASQLAAARVLLRRSRSPEPFGPTAGVCERLREGVQAYERGEGLLSALLLRCPEELRESLLSSLDGEFPAEALRLRRDLPTLEELADADPPSLRACLSAFSCDELALCLYELPEDQRGRILAALPALVREMVEERSRRMVPETSELVDAARTDLIARWRRLELCGRVRPLRGALS